MDRFLGWVYLSACLVVLECSNILLYVVIFVLLFMKLRRWRWRNQWPFKSWLITHWNTVIAIITHVISFWLLYGWCCSTASLFLKLIVFFPSWLSSITEYITKSCFTALLFWLWVVEVGGEVRKLGLWWFLLIRLLLRLWLRLHILLLVIRLEVTLAKIRVWAVFKCYIIIPNHLFLFVWLSIDCRCRGIKSIR